MIIAVRCFTCGKVIGHLWEPFKKRVKAGKNPEKVLDSLGVERYCCRALFVTNVDMMKKISQFKV